jgi:ketosteroid isomerase-like protein
VRFSAAIVAVIALVNCARASDSRPTPAEDEAAVKQTLIDWYAAYSGSDEAHYRSFVAEEYVLLENGTIMSLDDDLKLMRNRPSGYARKDTFDFKSVRLHGDFAYTTHFLESEIVDDKRVQQRKWLESAILRQIDGHWRVALAPTSNVPSPARTGAAISRLSGAKKNNSLPSCRHRGSVPPSCETCHCRPVSGNAVT